MGLASALGSFLGSGTGEAVAKPIDAIGDVIDKVFTSDDERLSHAEIMERLQQQPDLNQVDVNKIEATSSSLWVAGWRPAIGWVCAVAVANVYLINPWLMWITGREGVHFDVADLMALLFSMLGMAQLHINASKNGVK
jgi:hypothetical protein